MIYRFHNELLIENDGVKNGALFIWEVSRAIMLVLTVGVFWRVRKRVPDFFEEEVGIERIEVGDEGNFQMANIRKVTIMRK